MSESKFYIIVCLPNTQKNAGRELKFMPFVDELTTKSTTFEKKLAFYLGLQGNQNYLMFSKYLTVSSIRRK